MKNFSIGVAIVLAAAFSRLVPHPANMTAIAGMALAGGVYFNRRFALVVPLAALILSDAIIGFHPTIPFVYGSFLLAGLIGLWLRSHKRPAFVVGATLTASLIFFVVTNFGVWLTGGGWYYPRTIAGLVECYTMALPFFRNTVLGDLVSVAALFGLFELSSKLAGERKEVPTA